MDAEQLKRLENKDTAYIADILSEFNTKNANLLVFDSFHANNQWYALWLAIFGILDDATLAALHTQCLNTVRILTRDEFSLETHFIEPDVNTLLSLARLDGSGDDQDLDLSQLAEPQAAIMTETLKCLCNLVYQNEQCRRQCLRQHALDAVVKRLGNVSTMHSYPSTLEYHDMKLLFLLTALDPSARTRLQIDLNGMTYMTKWLDDKLTDGTTTTTTSTTTTCFTDEQLNTIIELLKVMFTVTSTPDKSPNESEIQSLHLTGVLRELLLRFGSLATERERAVVTHAINLLTNITSSCLVELTVKCSNAETEAEQPTAETETDVPQPAEGAEAAAAASAAPAPVAQSTLKCCAQCYERRNVRGLGVLLDFLRAGLNQKDTQASSAELLSPVLTVLVKCARSDRVMRHYLRQEILPPLKDVSQRPEIGNELRNHLCRFLTLPAMILRDLSAELLFVLCKEDVGRMIKYTGYGNAAGLFAKRGVLDCRRIETTEYSSDSEDSDTEEYKQQQQSFNPVLGCVEQPKRNPLEGMSEEQKEYEALQLVNLLDKLHQDGIVQPALIDKDGKAQPVGHILQLRDGLPQQQLDQKRKS
ncbi:synembryn [Drosophila sulfurigaster albostrigata]|uniref:synembryn n=1 Tax=Drosophila sulfurigaster albostrigata TaxID=89887 RepID=UPI002D21D9A7|nr:synembryn [Drosophila sulfurigaster albostrigata]